MATKHNRSALDFVDDLQWNMNANGSESFATLQDALNYVEFTSGMHINESVVPVPKQSIWLSVLNLIPLSLGIIGLLFNILALLIFTASKTFRQSPFRYYIYAFVLVNCASILSHSWLYMVFYIADQIRVCKYIHYLQQSLSTTSLWTMVLLSLERSFTFIRPFAVKNVLSSRTICLVIFLVICLCFLLHIDELVSVNSKAFRWVNFAYGLCSFKRDSLIKADRIKILTHSHSFILPFVLNTILDVYICYKICQRRKRLLEKTPSIVRKSMKFRRSRNLLANEITLILLWQSMWLLITYFPAHLYYFWISFKLTNAHDRDNSIHVFIIRLNLLVYLAFSPTLYVIFSPTLRREIGYHLCRSYKKRRATSSSCVSLSHRKSDNHLNERRRSRLSMLVTRSEELPRRCPQTTVKHPERCVKTFHSKSTPCLLPATQKNELYQYMKTERSSTLLQ
ncbi:unnamed protein product [Adineta ricciae]|uniref:G-protein coupled receptors family 1 profile domain-containing protein n=1 Tax=Adineta ricciae TaxID=249248 RepID=A0A813QPN6_ADIRI|nr:unnamed protein product [Adineta ricciae]CAF1379378.1 unnamed protein product [Adineta ricciae]